MRLIVDADACPRGALAACIELTRDCGIEMITVASFNHNVAGPRHIIVGDSPEEVDLKIANLAAKGDLVVTQDMGLAALVLARGAHAMNTMGREYRVEDMSLLLEERAAKARHRRGGGRTKGPGKRTAADEVLFRRGLLSLLLQKQQINQG